MTKYLLTLEYEAVVEVVNAEDFSDSVISQVLGRTHVEDAEENATAADVIVNKTDENYAVDYKVKILSKTTDSGYRYYTVEVVE